MPVIDTFASVGADGNGLFITKLDTGNIEHFYDDDAKTVTVPAFPGDTGTDPVEAFRTGNRRYLRWLRDVKADTRGQRTPRMRIVHRVEDEGADMGVEAIVVVFGSPNLPLLRATWTPTDGYDLQGHNGGTVSPLAAWRWAFAIERFLDNVEGFSA
jgi:hypothetical protein